MGEITVHESADEGRSSIVVPNVAQASEVAPQEVDADVDLFEEADEGFMPSGPEDPYLYVSDCSD